MIQVEDALNLLDIIKNEKVYTERLQKLKDEQEKLGEYRYIADTMEKANTILSAAKRKEEEASARLKSLPQEIEELKNKELEVVNKKRLVLDEKLKKIEASEESITKKLEEYRQLSQEIEERRKILSEWDKTLIEKQKELDQKEEFYKTISNNLKETLKGI